MITHRLETTGTAKIQKVALRNQGVDPAAIPSTDTVYWLQGGRYVEFGRREWERVGGGGVKL
jgi:hypothetical protein